MKTKNKEILLDDGEVVSIYYKRRKMRLEITSQGFVLWRKGEDPKFPKSERWIIDASLINKDNSFVVGGKETTNANYPGRQKEWTFFKAVHR